MTGGRPRTPQQNYPGQTKEAENMGNMLPPEAVKTGKGKEELLKGGRDRAARGAVLGRGGAIRARWGRGPVS